MIRAGWANVSRSLRHDRLFTQVTSQATAMSHQREKSTCFIRAAAAGKQSLCRGGNARTWSDCRMASSPVCILHLCVAMLRSNRCAWHSNWSLQCCIAGHCAAVVGWLLPSRRCTAKDASVCPSMHREQPMMQHSTSLHNAICSGCMRVGASSQSLIKPYPVVLCLLLAGQGGPPRPF